MQEGMEKSREDRNEGTEMNLGDCLCKLSKAIKRLPKLHFPPSHFPRPVLK